MDEEKKKRRIIGATAKRKGSNAERKFVKRFKEAGWNKAQTARMASKLADDCKMDIVFIPVNVQVKAGYAKGINTKTILREMKEYTKEAFPEHYPEHQNPNVIIHETDVGAGNKRTEYDTLVYMTFESFFDLICRLHDKGSHAIQANVLIQKENGTLEITTETEEETTPGE